MRKLFFYSRYIAISAFLFIGCSKNYVSEKEKRVDFTTSDTYATELLQGSMLAYFNEHPITHRELLHGDQCSQAYAVGMTSCHNQYVIEIVAILAGTGITIIFSGGFGTGIGLSMSALIAGAWAQLYSCQQGVISSWRICRENNPIH